MKLLIILASISGAILLFFVGCYLAFRHENKEYDAMEDELYKER